MSEPDRDLLLKTKNEKARCFKCNRLLGIFFASLSVPKNIGEMMRLKNRTLSMTVKDLEIKFGWEIKCNKCKTMNYDLEVV